MTEQVDQAPTRWDYWCPPEGQHVFQPNELHVGITQDNPDGTFTPVLTVAVLPATGPLRDFDGEEFYDQPESFAVAILEALKAGDWTRPDGDAAWMADKGLSIRWPDPAHAR